MVERYDVWRLLKEKRSELDLAVARNVLLQKCEHKGLGRPTVECFLATGALEAAEAYWTRDLAGQVPGSGDLPWGTVAEELEPLLVAFLDEDSTGSDTQRGRSCHESRALARRSTLPDGGD